MPSASYDVTVDSGEIVLEIASVNDKDMWVPASSAPGAVFGASGPSDIENLLDLNASETSGATLVITFDAEVPANELGFVMMDIDSENTGEPQNVDRFTVEATNAAGTDLTSSELNGGALNSVTYPWQKCPETAAATLTPEFPR